MVRGEPLLLARGRYERIGDNRNIVVSELESLGPLARKRLGAAGGGLQPAWSPPLRPSLSALS